MTMNIHASTVTNIDLLFVETDIEFSISAINLSPFFQTWAEEDFPAAFDFLYAAGFRLLI
jgi:hypothetical protein